MTVDHLSNSYKLYLLFPGGLYFLHTKCRPWSQHSSSQNLTIFHTSFLYQGIYLYYLLFVLYIYSSKITVKGNTANDDEYMERGKPGMVLYEPGPLQLRRVVQVRMD